MGSTAQEGRETPEARSPAARGIGVSFGTELGSPPSCPGCFGRLTPLTSTVASCALACLSASATAGTLGKLLCLFGVETRGRLFHHDFNRHRGNRSRLGPLEEPGQQDHRNDEMSRNRQSIGHAAVVGFLPKEMLQPLHHSPRVNWNCLNPVLFYLRHAFGFNTFSVTRMCSDRQRVGLRPLQRCRLGHETAVVAWSPCVCCRGRSGSRGL